MAESAFHDSSARFPPPRCHPDTRKGVISEIMAWHFHEADKGRCSIQSYRGEQAQKNPILWLHAPAGAGKSAIAQSIAEHCSRKPSSLAASFFFSRGVAERNTERHLVATLAYQIALSIPATKPFIENAVMDNPCIFSRSLETQFAKLVAEPLIQGTIESPLLSQWPTLILLDGLDECVGNIDGEQKQCAIINAIYATLTCFNIPLQFLVASRPEPHIWNIFNHPDVLSISHHLKLDSSFDCDQDIMAFLHAEFACICTYHPALVNWPTQKVIRHLTFKSSQQFIYAATVVKFVGDPWYNPIQRLDAILSTSTKAPLSPFINLDTLYHQILSVAQHENIDATLTIFSILEFCPKPLTLANILGFMDLSIQDVNSLLYNLHSIIKVSDLNSEVKFFHASFSDFLHNQSRAGHYYIGGGDRCAQVVQILLHAALDEHCQCANQPGIECHHTYAQQHWFQCLSEAEPTPVLLRDLVQYFLKVSKNLDEDPYVFKHIQTCLGAIVSVITWLHRFFVSQHQSFGCTDINSSWIFIMSLKTLEHRSFLTSEDYLTGLSRS